MRASAPSARPMIPPSISPTLVSIYSMKLGDLVRIELHKNKAIGIVVDIFDDLGTDDPWVRVLFTHPAETYQWCKYQNLTVVTKEEESRSDSPLIGATASGSL
jgi:hypothetical protein